MKQSVTEYLKSQFAEGMNVHAYIIQAERSEIPSLLKQCARIALCPNQGNDDCIVCRKVMKSEHQDWISLPLDKGKNRVTVEDISYLVEESMKRPVDSGEVRVFTIDATDSISGVGAVTWQNKLLKTLEEPVGNTVIFIGVTNADSLLRTVVSRSRVLCQSKATVGEIAQILQREGYLADKATIAAALCDGDLESAKKIIADSSWMQCADKALAMLTDNVSTKNALYYVSSFTQNKEDLPKIMKCLVLFLRESVAYRVAQQLVTLTEYQQQLHAISCNYSIESAFHCISLIEKSYKRLSNGGNALVEADNLVVSMLEVKYRCRI